MVSFHELSVNTKTLLLTLILMLNLCQYGYLVLLVHYRNRRRAMQNVFPALIVFFLIPFLTKSLHSSEGLLGPIPAAGIVSVWLLLIIYTLIGCVTQIVTGYQMLMPQSVKESADQLSSGLVFFSENGLIVLCNTKMQELYYQKTGRDLQLRAELEKELEDMILSLPNGSRWKLEKSEIYVDSRYHYTQFLAADVTELYRIKEEIRQSNEKMQVMIRQIQNISENIADITRQEEILTAKMRVHNKMGNCMLAARQYLRSEQDKPEEKMQLIRLWEENLRELVNEVGACDTPDAYEMVVQIANRLGLEVVLHGRMPENEKTAYLLVIALRECVTNALNHARAHRLDLMVEQIGDNIVASYTNDGIVPEGTIKEGGGLSSLRTKITNAGGNVQVEGQPVFRLMVILPLAERDA